MTLDEIRKALRNLSPQELQEVLIEFLPGAPPPAAVEAAIPEVVPTEQTALDVAAGVIAERTELLRRLASR